MAVNEFEPEDIFGELNQKFANVSLEQASATEDVYKEIMFDDVRVCHDGPILLTHPKLAV